jgi:hypothetical protein
MRGERLTWHSSRAATTSAQSVAGVSGVREGLGTVDEW